MKDYPKTSSFMNLISSIITFQLFYGANELYKREMSNVYTTSECNSILITDQSVTGKYHTFDKMVI